MWGEWVAMGKWMNELHFTGGSLQQEVSFEPCDNLHEYHCPHFTGEEIAIQRGEAIYPGGDSRQCNCGGALSLPELVVRNTLSGLSLNIY